MYPFPSARQSGRGSRRRFAASTSAQSTRRVRPPFRGEGPVGCRRDDAPRRLRADVIAIRPSADRGARACPPECRRTPPAAPGGGMRAGARQESETRPANRTAEAGTARSGGVSQPRTPRIGSLTAQGGSHLTNDVHPMRTGRSARDGKWGMLAGQEVANDVHLVALAADPAVGGPRLRRQLGHPHAAVVSRRRCRAGPRSGEGGGRVAGVGDSAGRLRHSAGVEHEGDEHPGVRGATEARPRRVPDGAPQRAAGRRQEPGAVVRLLRGGRRRRRLHGRPHPRARRRVRPRLPRRGHRGLRRLRAGDSAEHHLVVPKLALHPADDVRRGDLRAADGGHVRLAVAVVSRLDRLPGGVSNHEACDGGPPTASSAAAGLVKRRENRTMSYHRRRRRPVRSALPSPSPA